MRVQAAFPFRGCGLKDAPKPMHSYLVFYSSLPDIGAGFSVSSYKAIEPCNCNGFGR